MHKLFENYKAILLKSPAAVTSDAQTTGVDVSGYQEDGMVIVLIGAVTGTTPTCTVTPQTSDAVGGTYTDETALGALTDSNANDKQEIAVTLKGKNSAGTDRKFLRLDIDVGGTTPSFLIGAVLLVRAAIGKADLNSTTAA